ncbi:MAG TPA: hypothetical protein VHK47_12140 [Polyangia bacterium]|jgi:hypothetical protein|nr:hypothetical protein [Polyangia bacterium]
MSTLKSPKRPRSAGRERVPLDAPCVGLLLGLIDLRDASRTGAPTAPVDRRRGPHRAARA